MEKLEKVIEEKNILVFLLPTGYIRALDLTDTSVEKDSDCGIRISMSNLNSRTDKRKLNTDLLYKNGKPIHILLPEDMEKLQEEDYIFKDNALWLRYGCELHRKIIEYSFQSYLDKETYNEEESV